MRWNLRILVVMLLAIGLTSSANAAALNGKTAKTAIPLATYASASGTLTGSSQGAFAYYTFNYPGNGATGSISLNVKPTDSNTTNAVGVNLYQDGTGLLTMNALGATSGSNLGVFSSPTAGPVLVQVYNYLPGKTAWYEFTVTGVASPTFATTKSSEMLASPTGTSTPSAGGSSSSSAATTPSADTTASPTGVSTPSVGSSTSPTAESTPSAGSSASPTGVSTPSVGSSTSPTAKSTPSVGTSPSPSAATTPSAGTSETPTAASTPSVGSSTSPTASPTPSASTSPTVTPTATSTSTASSGASSASNASPLSVSASATGSLTGSGPGNFRYYTFDAAGLGAAGTITITVTPNDPNTTNAVGVNLYQSGVHVLDMNALGTVSGTNSATFTSQSNAPILIQVYNYLPGQAASYHFKITMTPQ